MEIVKSISSEKPVKKSKYFRPVFQNIKNYLPSISLFIVFLLVWEGYVRISHTPKAILPSPSLILSTLINDFPRLWDNLQITMLEIVLGFLLGLVGGIVTGILIVYSRTFERLLYPIVIASQVIPVFAIAPLLIIWFGFGILPKVIIAALIVFFPICVNQVEGLRSADKDIINLMKAYNAKEFQIFKIVRFPASFPFLLAGTQVGITFSVIGAVIGEWVGSEKGIGALMVTANSMSRTDLVFASIIVLAILGIFLFVAVKVVGDWMMPWQKGIKATKE